MSIRHKAIKATLDVGTASEWNDDHEGNFETWVMHQCLDPGHVLTVAWNTGQKVGATTQAWAMVSGHAFVDLTTPANTNDIATIRHMLGSVVSNMTHPDGTPIITFGLQIAAVHDAAGVANSVAEFGFQDDTDALFTQNLHHAIFRVYNGKLHAVTGDGAAETETEIADYNEYGHYRIEIVSGHVYFYVDNMVTPAADHTTNIPNADMTIKFSVRSKNNVASTIRVDGLCWCRLRKQ